MRGTDQAFEPLEFVKTLTRCPGVYLMLDAHDEVIYVGKAKNLKNRVTSYFVGRAPDPKIEALRAHVRAIDITVTRTELEALLLESNLIKKHQPRYNVALRDDKSYPYLVLSQHTFPRLQLHRGALPTKARCFGPYPNARSARETLAVLQKVFKVRPCRDSFFANRSRPCLQYQIQRCSAPCVGYISPEEYSQDLRHLELFLSGQEIELIEMLADEMEQFAASEEFEQAARLRDQIGSLKQVQQGQIVNQQRGQIDVVAVGMHQGVYAVSWLIVRHGRMLGSRQLIPKVPEATSLEQVLADFLVQHYLEVSGLRADELILSHRPTESEWIFDALRQRAQRALKVTLKPRGYRASYRQMALTNCQEAIKTHLASKQHLQGRFQRLAETFGVPFIRTLACFDVSHLGGEQTVAACVVCQPEGFNRQAFRRFNVEGITPGDDIAAMYQVVHRYFDNKERKIKVDVLLIDGGKGQLTAALQALQDAGGHMPQLVVGVAKGEGRRPGLETLYLGESFEALQLSADDEALHLVQMLRDEAHRFAITAQRHRRRKQQGSVLEQIPGVGPQKRRALLRQFGGLQAIQDASREDLEKVPGINRTLAMRIYDGLHNLS